MKVLLINPPTGRYMRSDRCQAPVDTRVAEPARPPIDLAYMAAILEEEGIECRIKDYPMESRGWKEAASDINKFYPDILIISTTTPTIESDLIICDLAKEINPKIITVAKGAHFLVFDRLILERFKNLDIVIRGEPEDTIRELAKAGDYSLISGITFRDKSGIVRNPERNLLESLDGLPLPARHLLNNNLYSAPDTGEPLAFVSTSRGCPYLCIFCAAGKVSGSKVRMRSVKSVIEEIEECVKRFGIRNFFFSADTFTWDKQWVIEFCATIVSKGLKIRWGTNSRVDTLDDEKASSMSKAGCYIIGFGAESASQYMLDKMRKGITVTQIESAVNLCRKYGMESFLVFVIGLPWETKETVDETIRFIKKTQASFIEVNVAYPIPGTDFYNLAKDEALFDENNLSGHNYSAPLVRSFALSTDELVSLRKKILKSFYIRPGYIAGRIRKINSPKGALNYFKYGIRLINNLLST